MAFAYPSNFSNGTAVEGIGTFLQYAGYTTDGLMGYAILITIFLMTFIVSLSAGSRKALLSSSFITFIFSVWFWKLGMVQAGFVFAFVLVMVIAIVGSKSSSAGGY